MRIGTIGYRTRTGLGYQVLDYVKWLKISKVLVADLSGLNGVPLTNWYMGARTCKGYPSDEDCKWLVQDIDVLLLAETPLNYNLYRYAKDKGVKIVNVINAEFYDHKKYPEHLLPDVIIMPSVWLLDMVKEHAEPKGVKVVQLHHPVDRTIFKYRERTTNKTYHIAGKPATLDRNGTWDYLQAELGGKVITQDENLARHIRSRYSKSNVFTDIADNAYMYHLGDIMVLPRRYGGNCLPLNEALSSGSPVIMPDISPNDTLLPKEWLVHAVFDGTFAPRGDNINIYRVERPALQERIAYIKSQDPRQMSRMANDIAETISWDNMLDKWQEAIYG